MVPASIATCAIGCRSRRFIRSRSDGTKIAALKLLGLQALLSEPSSWYPCLGCQNGDTNKAGMFGSSCQLVHHAFGRPRYPSRLCEAVNHMLGCIFGSSLLQPVTACHCTPCQLCLASQVIIRARVFNRILSHVFGYALGDKLEASGFNVHRVTLLAAECGSASRARVSAQARRYLGACPTKQAFIKA